MEKLQRRAGILSWIALIGPYMALMILLSMLCRHLFRNKFTRVVRTLLAGTLLLMLGEIIAEERGLWIIPSSSGVYFLKAPVEGALLVLATLLNSLLAYLIVRSRLLFHGSVVQPDTGEGD